MERATTQQHSEEGKDPSHSHGADKAPAKSPGTAQRKDTKICRRCGAAVPIKMFKVH